MARKKIDEPKIKVGNIADVSGEINIATGDIYNGFTAKQVSVLIKQITSTFQAKKFDGRCPYKGLDVFEEEDADLFFGREKLVGDLVRRVKESRTVFVTGPSGSGKSSLVRAGLIHALKQGAIKDLHSERWLYATMKPGRDPLGELARMTSGLASSTNAEDEVRAKAMTDVTILARWCEIALKEGRNKRAVLFIDQFEEVFTQISKETERVAFLNLLTHAATVENGRLIILFSMRSDFVSNCATYPQLNDLLNQQFIQIGAMQPDELVSAIAQPALRVGLHIDPDLIAQIINDMQGEPGALPLMQFALKDLFNSQEAQDGVIALMLKDYLKRGGIHKALERHADASFTKLEKHEQELARSIFSGLIEIGRGTQDTKRTALFDELIPASAKSAEVEAIVTKLADARLITTDEAAGKETVTISHEKLIDAWPWLKKLVTENHDIIALQNEISSDSKDWNDHKQNSSYLYTGARLVTARKHIENKKIVLGKLALQFIKASYYRQRRIQWAVISIVATLGLMSTFFSYQSSSNASIAKEYKIIANTAQAESTTAKANLIASDKQVTNAMSRQLAKQAQALYTPKSNQIVAVLLAIRSMQLFPNTDAAQILQSNTFALSVSKVVFNDSIFSVAISPDNTYAAAGSNDSTIRVWKINNGENILQATFDRAVSSVVFSPDNKYIAAGSYDFTVRIWEVATRKEVLRLTHDEAVSSIAFSPNGNYLLTGDWGNIARVWEIASGSEIGHFIHADIITSVVFSPDGKFAVTSSRDNTARVWEISTGIEISRMTHDNWVNSITISPDGTYIASGSNDGTARIWELATGKEITRTNHDGSVIALAFSPNGKFVVSGGQDGTARAWDISGKEIGRTNHGKTVYSVAISSDSKYAVSGGGDGTARVWEVTTGNDISYMTHNDVVYAVAISNNANYIETGGWDSTASTWIFQPNKDVSVDLVLDSCQRIPRNLTFAEWREYIGGQEPYQAICGNLPIEAQATPTP